MSDNNNHFDVKQLFDGGTTVGSFATYGGQNVGGKYRITFGSSVQLEQITFRYSGSDYQPHQFYLKTNNGFVAENLNLTSGNSTFAINEDVEYIEFWANKKGGDGKTTTVYMLASIEIVGQIGSQTSSVPHSLPTKPTKAVLKDGSSNVKIEVSNSSNPTVADTTLGKTSTGLDLNSGLESFNLTGFDKEGSYIHTEIEGSLNETILLTKDNA